MAIATIRTQLVALMTELTGVGKPLQAVYDYQEPSPQQYPVAMVLLKGVKESRLTTDSNLETATFLIRVILREKNSTAQEDLKVAIIDSVMDKFRENDNYDTLDGVVEMTNDMELEVFHANTEESDIPITGFDFFLSASKIKAIL